jgi:hypothetical protein
MALSNPEKIRFIKSVFHDTEDESGPLIVAGVVYQPGDIDTDGEAVTKEDIEAAAYLFLASGRINRIDIYHNEILTGCRVVASWVFDADGEYWVAGAWVMKVAIFDPAIKRLVISGEISGFSFQGDAMAEKKPAYIMHPLVSTGTTEKSSYKGPMPIHDHALELHYDDKGEIVRTRTGITLGHYHDVKYLGATELTLGHAHPLRVDTSQAKAALAERIAA